MLQVPGTQKAQGFRNSCVALDSDTGRLFVLWFLQCIKGDNGIFNGYEESLTLVCMKLFEMHEGHYSV